MIEQPELSILDKGLKNKYRPNEDLTSKANSTPLNMLVLEAIKRITNTRNGIKDASSKSKSQYAIQHSQLLDSTQRTTNVSKLEATYFVELARNPDIVENEKVLPLLSSNASQLILSNVETLRELLKRVVACRAKDLGRDSLPPEAVSEVNSFGTAMLELVSIIDFPGSSTQIVNTKAAKLSAKVESQLFAFVTSIASMYRPHSFHNFERATRVTKCLVRFLGQMVAPSCSSCISYIIKQPLTRFAFIFAALVHDLDHAGVSNVQLVKEKAYLASAYDNRSISQQNSIDIAWGLLMDSEKYADLRAAIYSNDAERKHFRQVVVNLVLATDLTNHELKTQREARWHAAFENGPPARVDEVGLDSKATILMEYMVQAADIGHTMDSWEEYTKWSASLFEEKSQASDDGRANHSPADNWYQRELQFFEFHAIPLTMKLQASGVFGSSGDDLVRQAAQNRHRWQETGREIVADLVLRHMSAPQKHAQSKNVGRSAAA